MSKRKMDIDIKNKRLDILNRIEEAREKLHALIIQNKSFDDEVIKLSQYLDKLLVEYMKHSGRESRDKKY